MSKGLIRAASALVCAAVPFLLAQHAFGQAYPAKPIRVLVPFPPEIGRAHV